MHVEQVRLFHIRMRLTAPFETSFGVEQEGIRPDGLPMWWSAAQEGGERNGVLTAVEDFMDERGGLRLAIIPSFFGFGVLWETGAPYADALEDLLGPWDRHPVLQRLVANGGVAGVAGYEGLNRLSRPVAD